MFCDSSLTNLLLLFSMLFSIVLSFLSNKYPFYLFSVIPFFKSEKMSQSFRAVLNSRCLFCPLLAAFLSLAIPHPHVLSVFPGLNFQKILCTLIYLSQELLHEEAKLKHLSKGQCFRGYAERRTLSHCW